MDLSFGSSPYNNFSLNTLQKYDITTITLINPIIKVDNQIRLISCNGNPLSFIKNLINLLRLNQFHIIHTHNVHVSTMLIFACIFSKYKYLKKTIFTIHNSYENYSFKHLIQLPFIFLFMNKIVFCSNSSKKSFPFVFRLLSKGKGITICNGVDYDSIFKVKRSLKKNIKNHFTLIFLGRLIEKKNPMILLKAFQELDLLNSKLIFVGDGPLRKKIENEANNKVLFRRNIPREKVYHLLCESDLFISMSETEGLPIATLEALSAGLPVILSKINSHLEISIHFKNITLIPPNDISKLKNKILEFYNMDVEKRKIEQLKNENIIKNKFSLQNMLLEYDKLYNTFEEKIS